MTEKGDRIKPKSWMVLTVYEQASTPWMIAESAAVSNRGQVVLGHHYHDYKSEARKAELRRIAGALRRAIRNLETGKVTQRRPPR